MSKEIDWSKAPERATHYSCVNDMFYVFSGPHSGKCWSVSRQDWIAAGRIEEYSHMAERPSPAWNGDGLPSVGTVCHAHYLGTYQGIIAVRYSGDAMVLWSDDRQSEQCGMAEHYIFRPATIRTPEQIAADEREAAIKEMTADYADHSAALKGWAIYVYDELGYRKP